MITIPTGSSTDNESLVPRARLLTSQLMITAKQEMVVGYAGSERKSMLQFGVKGGEAGTVFA
jgi:hypothetical protein